MLSFKKKKKKKKKVFGSVPPWGGGRDGGDDDEVFETVGLLGTGTQDVHLDFHTTPELLVVVVVVVLVSIQRKVREGV